MFGDSNFSFTPIANLLRPMPMGRKLAMFISNNWLKIKRLRGCCGNHTHPGC